MADELYGLTPAEFIPRRDALAAEARKAGDRALAAEIKKLRRPTTGAWLANVLARQRRDQVAQLLDLGAALRQAQASLATSELRRLSQERHAVLSELEQKPATWPLSMGRLSVAPWLKSSRPRSTLHSLIPRPPAPYGRAG